MEPIVNGLEKQYGTRMTFVRIDVNAAENRGLVDQYHISGVPTMFVLDKSGTISDTVFGTATSDKLDGLIKKTL